MRILATIITYNPDLEILKENIDAIYEQAEEILIVDNNSNNYSDVQNLTKKYKISLVTNSSNKGIAYALNQSLKYATDKNYNWLLTLDQDSKSSLDLLNQYRCAIKQETEKNIVMYVPEILDINLSEKEKSNSNDRQQVDFAITSGTLLNVLIANNLRGFDSNLFIDYVDFEFCLNARKNGYKIIKVNKAILFHRLGESEFVKFLKFKFKITNHSPLRRYYVFRNKIYLYKKYFTRYPKWVIRNLFSSLKTILLICFFEKEKILKLKSIAKGIKDGVKM